MTSDIAATLQRLAPYAQALESVPALQHISEDVATARNDTAWLRERYQQTKSLTDVVRAQAKLWMGRQPAGGPAS